MKTLKKIPLILIFLAGVAVIGVIRAPGLLLYETRFEKSDVIVVLLGPDFSARNRHARELMQRGMSDYLIIPAYHKTYFMDQGVIKNMNHTSEKAGRPGENNLAAPRYVEDTHLELLEAKKMMAVYGRTSAIFVSSPYHMRRIQLIVKKVYGNDGRYYFSPTPYETAPQDFRQLKSSDWKKVWREYLKISWFMIYSLWHH